MKLVATVPDESSVLCGVLPSGQGARFQLQLLYCGNTNRGNELQAITFTQVIGEGNAVTWKNAEGNTLSSETVAQNIVGAAFR